jgi:putative oxidoreductase
MTFFGGHGLDGTGAFFESLGLRPGRMMALAAGLAELTGGALFALGLLTPLAATLLIAVMVTAIATVHGRNGVWVTNGGFEYNLVLAAVPFAVASIGAGKWSLDHVLGLHVAGAKRAANGAGSRRDRWARERSSALRSHGTTGATPARA